MWLALARPSELPPPSRQPARGTVSRWGRPAWRLRAWFSPWSPEEMRRSSDLATVSSAPIPLAARRSAGRALLVAVRCHRHRGRRPRRGRLRRHHQQHEADPGRLWSRRCDRCCLASCHRLRPRFLMEPACSQRRRRSRPGWWWVPMASPLRKRPAGVAMCAWSCGAASVLVSSAGPRRTVRVLGPA